MKHFRFALFLIAALAFNLNVNAQYVTSHAKIVMPGQQKGMYYALPRTVIQLDFIVEEIELIEGPYSDYVYLVGADEYVTGNGKEYRLADVRMSTYAEADPNATFFVAMNTKKGEGSEFVLNSKGILQGIGIEPAVTVDPPVFPMYPQNVAKADKSFKYQYGSNAMRGEEQLAHNAAEMVSRIREEKIKLITGFQETPFTLETYRQMLADLEEMEAEYLSLFIGKRIVTTTVKTVYVTPTKEVPTQTIGKFSPITGFTTNVAGVGSLITLQAISLNTTGNINEPSQSAVESLSHENKLFYRIPETVNVRLTIGNETIIDRRETMAQFGVFMLAPLGRHKMTLDPNTGQIISMGME